MSSPIKGGEEAANKSEEAYSLEMLPRHTNIQQDDSSNSTHGKSTSTPDEGADISSPAADQQRKRPISKPTIPSFLKPSSRPLTHWSSFKAFLAREANFYRIHVIVFTLTPLIFSGIFYASNSVYVAYIDCLFLCVSAMTVTGLTTINISIITPWQQAILYFLMTIGNITAVSILMVLIRRHFFRAKFNDVIARSSKARKRMKDVEEAHQKEKHEEFRRLQKKLGLKWAKTKEGEHSPGDESPGSTSTNEEAEQKKPKKKGWQRKKLKIPLRADMIRRMDGPAVLINQAGMPSRAVKDPSQDTGLTAPGGILNSEADLDGENLERSTSPDIRFDLPEKVPSSDRRGSAPQDNADDPLTPPSPTARRKSIQQDANNRSNDQMKTRFHDGTSRDRSGSDPSRGASLQLRRASDTTGQQSAYNGALRSPMDHHFPRTQTVEFSEPYRDRDRAVRTTALPTHGEGLKHRSTTLEVDRFPTTATTRSGTSRRQSTAFPGSPMTRQYTTAKERGFGGFPTPFEIASQAIGHVFPKMQEHITRTTTMPRSTTFTSVYSNSQDPAGSKPVPYLTFDATVSRNSRFQELTEAQRDELGGVEYRAIDLLSKILPAYFLIFQLFIITMVAPWLASSGAAQVHQVLATQGQDAPDTTWMWFFNVMSAYSNTGMSLIDTSMTLLPTQYFMLIPMAVLILAGNTAFPICLRFFIWIISQFSPKRGRLYETLRFLLDHPRRCFVYLFPSGQTWFLFGVLVLLNSTDWIFFQVLDIGNPTIESWGIGQRIFDGLFQSFAVRAAGFQIISLLTLAPAVQFLYIVMMYISAYPVAMSVRNTNVYEERSLGLYNEEPADTAEPQTGGARVWGNYLAAHARRQLAFDIWWLGFALWLICIIQKKDIQDPNTDGYFTVFNCLFELTSAYGTVGLSTGTPNANYSLSGEYRTLGKLVVIAVMLRGRHRGLPVAIDRAVLLPGELDLEDEAGEAYDEEMRARTMTTSGSGFLPRTGTGYSRSARERFTSSPEREDFDKKDENDEKEQDHHEEGKPVNLGGLYPGLSAIQEGSPSATPLDRSRAVSRADNEPAESSASSSSKSGEVASEYEKRSAFLGGAKMSQLPSTVETVHSTSQIDPEEEKRLDELDEKYRERYGSSTTDDQH
jgi:potassium uptake Trk family protein